MAYKIILQEWGLAEFITYFEEEGIDDTSFHLIDDNTISQLFPKIGPRLIFKDNLKKYKERRNIKSLSTPPLSPSLDLARNLINSDTDSTDTTISLLESYLSSPGDSFTVPAQSTSVFTQPQSPIKRPLEESVVSPPAKHSKKSDRESVFPEGLESILRKYTDGQIIILNRTKLNNDQRQKLCKIIINELISLLGTEIRASTFLKLTEEIENTFINERAGTYYIPYIPGEKSKKGSGPKGKLWSRFVNVKAALRLANSHKRIDESPPYTATTDNNRSPEKDPQEIEHLEFLKVGTEPFTKVLEAWENTFKARRKQYMNSELNEIYLDFPCLKLNSGLELIETDFNRRFPEKIDTIYTNWPKVVTAIIDEATERNIQLTNTTNDIQTRALLVLPFLFSPITLKKSRKGTNWRPTRSEVQDSFFLHVMNFDELDERINIRKQKLLEYNVTIQPFGAIVTDDQGSTSFYVIVDDVKYKIDTCIRALELLYKVFHALDVEYPIESEHVWLFIQELVFSMKSSKKSPAMVTLAADIKFHLMKT